MNLIQAFRKHEQCNPLMNIGEADLTADVDFSALKKKVTPKLITLGPVTQRQFLKQMNIDIRLEVSSKKLLLCGVLTRYWIGISFFGQLIEIELMKFETNHPSTWKPNN